VTSECARAQPDLHDQLGGIATRLIDIAGNVATEAEMATAVMRGMTDQAARMAQLAVGLEAAAAVMEDGVRQQAQALTLARQALATNKPVIDALEQSVASVAAISGSIASIAQASRILSLNARIEAARAGVDGAAFAVVATEMSILATQTKDATDQIGTRARVIAEDVGAAHELVDAYGVFLAERDDLLAVSLGHATRQRDTSVELAAITAETVGTVDQAASAIGRVGANAVAVKVLARQLSRLSEQRIQPAAALVLAA
jgi:methyl-accepting chemotaxis protein